MKKWLRLLLFIAGLPLAAILLFTPEKKEAKEEYQIKNAEELPFMVMLCEDRGTYAYEPEEAVCHITAALLTKERLAAFDNLENGEGKRQEYLKALAVVCRTNMLYTWKQEQCPEELDIKKTGLPFRKLKQNSNEELWIREAVEESTGAVIMDGSKEERTVIAIPFFTSSDWEIKIGEAGEGIGLSLNYALLLAQEGSEFTQIIRYFFPESKIRVE